MKSDKGKGNKGGKEPARLQWNRTGREGEKIDAIVRYSQGGVPDVEKTLGTRNENQ